LKFLATYLLSEDIQGETHDSIEDARTAIKLYEKYLDLQARGEFEQELLEMYRYGKIHGFKGETKDEDGSETVGERRRRFDERRLMEEPATRHVCTRHLRTTEASLCTNSARQQRQPPPPPMHASTSTAHARAVYSIWRHLWHGAASATAADATVGQFQPDEPAARHECSHGSTLWRRAATIPAADAATEWRAHATRWRTHATRRGPSHAAQYAAQHAQFALVVATDDTSS
jgi:hypothetical protein